ncbi:MAG: hypothetical protein AB8B62_09820 [Roseobacter sp.]
MPPISRSLLISATAVFLASAAHADLTAEDIWNDWRSYTKGFGYLIQGTETKTDSGLTVTGATIASQSADGVGRGTIFMDQVVLTETADGTVTIDLPAIMPIELSALDDAGKPLRISMDYRQTDLNIVASGTPDALRYTYDAQEITIVTTGFERDGQPTANDELNVEIALEDIDGVTNVEGDGIVTYDQNLNAAALRFAVDVVAPEEQGTANISGQMQNVSFEGQSALPTEVEKPDDMEEMLEAGFKTEGAFAYQAYAMTLATTSPRDSTEMSFISDKGRFGVTLDTAGLDYDISQENVQVQATSSGIPIPIEFAAARTAFNFAMPIQQTEQFGDFALGLTFDDVSMSDLIWSLFDPGAQLPRDPATLVLDVTGKTRLLFNFLDPAAAPTLSPGQMPAELQSLDVNTLQLQAAGSELTGDGAFTFENSDFGPPKPMGALNLTLIGGNTLINQLVATGLLLEDQAMGVRMMMGLLAVPGDTPDTLKSRIEINAEGHVLANGQRIQ